MDKTPKTKVCSKCGKRRLRSQFYARKASADGLAYVCKICDDARTKSVPAEKKRAKHKAWRDANRDHVREKARDVMRRLYAADPEKFKQRAKDYRALNLEKIKERNAAKRGHLSDSYVKRVLFPDGIPSSVPQELIEAKRVQLQLTRYLKNGN